MKPNEFVKKHGIKKTSSELSVFQSSLAGYFGWDFVDELKQLVKAYEFVEAHGSIEKARKYVNFHDPRGKSKHYNNLRARIADVESCKA